MTWRETHRIVDDVKLFCQEAGVGEAELTGVLRALQTVTLLG